MRLQHVLSTKQFLERQFVETLFKQAADLEGKVKKPVGAGKVLATLFYEPSTRTRLSFETAMLRLGGQVITTENAAQFSSAVKGETLEDSIRIVSGYADLIVLRHPEVGAAARAATVSNVPVINAGDGAGEHPTQALLDLYTISKELGRIDSLHIVFVGDLLYGRTVHSLLQLLSITKKLTVSLVAPAQLRLPDLYKQELEKQGVTLREYESLDPVLAEADVLYVTRVQKERFADASEYERLKHVYVINQETLKKLKPKSIIMHPLPRVGEIAPEVDADPRAAYFREAVNGLYVRMALLQLLLTGGNE